MSAKQEVERGNWADLQPQPAHHHTYRLPPRQEKPLSPPAHLQQHRPYQPPSLPPPQPQPPQQQLQQPPAQQQQQQQQTQEHQQQQQLPQPPPPPPLQQPPQQQQQQPVVTLPRPPPPPPLPYAQQHHPVPPVPPVQPVQPPASQPAPAAWHCDEATARLRTEEDRHAHEAFVHKAHKLAERLHGLGERRSHLENELASVNASVAMTEKDMEAVQEQYHSTMAKLQHERALEDRQKWMDPSRRTSNRDMGSQSQPPAAGGWTSINGARPRAHDDEEPPADPGNLLGKGYRSVEEGETNGRVRLPGVANGHAMDVDDLDQGLAYRPRKADEPRPLKPKQQRHSLPGFSAVNRGSPKHEIPLEPKARSPSGRRSLPAARSHAAPAEPEEPVDDTEINLDTFQLRHNGKMYTEPAMYYGVPLERISPDHPYWDPNWQPLEDIIKPQLEKWQEKLTMLRQTPDAVRHTVFLANRQVNRGQSVIDFLKDGDFHPYQYVGKEMMEKFYKTFINYDTMFRLVNIHEELKKFDLELTPLEWLRQRMYEVSQAQGDKFSLSKYTHDLYHDPKLKQLREKHGFGNIGRPSGYKIGEKNPDKGKAKAKREPTGGTRRKNRRSIGQVDMDEQSMMEQQHYYHMHHPAHPLAHGEFLDPQTPRLQKRPRIEGPPMAIKPERTPEPVVDDLECDGYTSTDSFSAGRISHLDFRVYQVKSPALTTSTEVTQYWTWDQDKELFEHQVLRDVHPKVTWGYYQKSANFDIKLDELVNIQYAVEDQKVIVSTKDQARPVVMAHLKRERTKRRFLAFVKKRGVKIVKTKAALIETAWNDMKSNDTLPGESESPSS